MPDSPMGRTERSASEPPSLMTALEASLRPIEKNRISVQDAYRKAKPELASLVIRHASSRGQEWVRGGPDHWSKDELVARLVEMGVVS